MPSPVFLSAAIAASASMAVAGHALRRPALVYVFKPLTTALLILLAAAGQPLLAPRYAAAIVAGLSFSLAGDVFLMLPSDRFKSGLFSFLLAHFCYVLAFTSDSPFATPLSPLLVSLAFGFFILSFLWPGIPGRLRLPVLAYVVVLLLMAGQGVSRALILRSLPALCASFGAALFVLSDSVLAWNRFRAPLRAAQVLIHATYFPAQWLIAMSAWAAWRAA